MNKNVLLLGASLDTSRYSNICLHDLASRSIPTFAVGLKEGDVAGIKVSRELPEERSVHTVTLYLGAKNQHPFYHYILDLMPERVIFNPGTENPEFEKMLSDKGIEVLSACSIMMLHAGVFFDE